MSEFSTFDKHVILYSKGWYKETDTISDIRTLLSRFSGTDVKYIKDVDVLSMVSDLVFKLFKIRPATQHDLDIMFKELWAGRLWEVKTTITMSEHVDSLLRVLRYKRNDETPELVDPDESWLPFAHVDTLERWKALRG